MSTHDERAREILKTIHSWPLYRATVGYHQLEDAIAAALVEARVAERICPKCGIRIDHECGGPNDF